MTSQEFLEKSKDLKIKYSRGELTFEEFAEQYWKLERQAIIQSDNHNE